MGLPKLVWDWLVEANIVKFGGVDVPLSCDIMRVFVERVDPKMDKSDGQPSSIHTPMQTIEVPHPEMSLSGSLLPFSWSLSCNSNGRVHPIKSYEPLTFHRWVSTIRLLSEATVSNPVSDMNLDHNVCVCTQFNKINVFPIVSMFFHLFSQFVYYHDSSSDWFARCGPHPSPWSQR